ncbi:MAG: dihydrolipoyl dehydrogenase [Pseudomonadota bacterium]|nr:dihydrolipoyl dehydrogenase [Pseudomonadota bacterium]
MSRIDVLMPDIGDFKDIPVIEILVKPGDAVQAEDSLITLESDKATMDIPSPQAGVVSELQVKVGDRVSEGRLILRLETTGDAAAGANPPTPSFSKGGSAETVGNSGDVAAGASPSPIAKTEDDASARNPEDADAPHLPPFGKKGQGEFQEARETHEDGDFQAEVLVLGAGPGGYTAAFRAADLGKNVVLVERHAALGGVCLNVGCIPSKALLHVAKVIAEADDLGHCGVTFSKPEIDLARLRGWKNGVVAKLTKGLAGLAERRKVRVLRGVGQFASPHTLRVETAEGTKTVRFEQAVIAAGSEATRLPNLPYHDARLLDSTSALALDSIPRRLLVIGGGIIGLEMACFYDALGSTISVVEMTDSLLPGVDRDLVKPLHKRIAARYENILLNTKVSAIEPQDAGLLVRFESASTPAGSARDPQVFDQVLLAIGRRPNGKTIAAQKAGVAVDERGFIRVDARMRSNVAHIFAIGDIVGEPMLAHKATHEGKLAAEIICGHKTAFDARAIPSVAYTDPEIAWMGLSETAAKANAASGNNETSFDSAVFPWAASGRALAQDRSEGMTKLLFDRGSRKLLGAGIVGPNAGELIAETVLALEMGADIEDLALTIHPHPTLSETIFFAAEIAAGSITDLMPRK